MLDISFYIEYNSHRFTFLRTFRATRKRRCFSMTATDTANKLSAQRVREIFLDCLFKDGEDTTDHVKAEGITTNIGFHPGRIQGYAEELAEMLGELPEQFMASVGGGWSFLNACLDKHGNHWAEHQTMEQLFQLGIATDKVKCQLPRDMWASLPGGMPYYVVKDN